MSDHDLTPVVSVAVFDYARFVVRGDADYVMQHINRLTNTYDAYRTAHGISAGGCKAWGVPATESKPAGRVWECWGIGAQFVYLLPFAPWARWLSRLDVRATIQDVDALGLQVIYDAFRAGGVGRTISHTISPSRQKRGGQSTGGDTVAVGSHKSDIRLSWYKKADQPVAFEIQASHDVLQKEAWATVKQMEEKSHNPEGWWLLSERLWRQADLRIKKLSGYEHLDLLRQALNARADALLMGMMPAIDVDEHGALDM